jgi:threonine dehydratase
MPHPTPAVVPPGLSEIETAAGRLHGVCVRTPLVALHTFEADDGILIKPEIHQPAGSFKVRGVFNAVAALEPEVRTRGLSTVSAGNTAQALAWTARRFGVAAQAIMPEGAPVTKVEAVRRYGARPVLVPVEELFRFLKERLWEREPHAFVHPWTDRNVMIGHGTIGLEIFADCPDVETVYVPVGGGGLIGGVGSALRARAPGVRVVAVEPQGCPALHRSLKRGHPVEVSCRTMCDGVAVPYITDEMFPLLQEIVDEVVLVSEQAVRSTIRRLARYDRVIVEGAGALAVAAALATPLSRRGRSVCLLTGGSIDTDAFLEILGRA